MEYLRALGSNEFPSLISFPLILSSFPTLWKLKTQKFVFGNAGSQVPKGSR